MEPLMPQGGISFRELFKQEIAEPFENARAILNAVGKEGGLSRAAQDLRAEVGLIEYDESRARYYRFLYEQDGVRKSQRVPEAEIRGLTERILDLY